MGLSNVLVYIVLAALAPLAAAQDRSELDAIWNDPVFQRQFVAGYGVHPDVEPRLSQDEIALLEKVRPLIADTPAQAEELLRSQMKANCSASLDVTLAGIRSQQDKLDAAVQSYRTAVTKFPSFRRAWRQLGVLHMRMENYDEAIAAFTRFIELGGGDAYSYGLLAFAHASKQDYQPAESAYRTALLLQPDNTQWRFGLTNCVFRQGKYDDAAALLDVLIARYPDKPNFWLLQAQTFLNKKQPLRAAENLEAMDRLGKSTLETLYLLGDVYLNEGLLDLSLRAYARAVELDEQQPVVKALRAAEQLSVRKGAAQSRQLSSRIHQAWDARLEDTERRRLLKLDARLAMAAGGDDEQSTAILEELLKLDPLDGEALMLLGQHHQRRNEPDRAMLCYERAANLEAYEITARVKHAQVLVGLGRHGEALPLLRRAQELRPREDVARYVEQVERFARAKR